MPEVYEERKKQFIKRIRAMEDYATNNQCRSRLLLSYFGEKSSHDCGQCDVCLEHPSDSGIKDDVKAATDGILCLLSDNQPHHIAELKQLRLPFETIDTALSELLAEEQIYQRDGLLTLTE